MYANKLWKVYHLLYCYIWGRTSVYVHFIPFPSVWVREWLKVFGILSQTKWLPKKYRQWLISKVENRLNLWCNCWLSQRGRLLLVKVVLEAIPIYWMSLSQIPKSVLDVIRRHSFRFIWSRSREKKGIPLLKWKRLFVSKARG